MDQRHRSHASPTLTDIPDAERRAGVLVPLFSIRSSRGWGIGEFPDLGPFAQLLATAGQTVLQLLPLGEVGSAETSPYGALTAFGLDPTYLALDDVEDFVALGAPAALGDAGVTELERVRAAGRVDYLAVRRLKQQALRAAFGHFRDGPLAAGGAPARALADFVEQQRAWLPDYALFRALRDEHREAGWQTWAAPLRERRPEALADAAARLKDEVRFYEYVQWQCDIQLGAARRAVNGAGMLLKGDLPFMVSGDSADVWAHQDQFRTDVRLGAPPDQFSPDGQDWGLPVYDWEVMERDGLAWIRQRAARAAAHYDMFRVDHVVGFYRQFVIEPGEQGELTPAEEGDQIVLGERVLSAMLQAAGEVEARRPANGSTTALTIVAEDLGVVPPYVRRSLTGLGIPGTKVQRWEKTWEKDDGRSFLDPAHYAPLSLCTSGTHDTSTLASWYEDELDQTERHALFAIPALLPHARVAGPRFTPEVHGALLEGLYGAGSALCILPIQDLLGSRDRINTPSTVSTDNWVYRLPLTVDQMRRDGGIAVLLDRARRLGQKHGRAAAAPARAATS
ncbi:MAG TPA: 4-alpha-glucanotransferase [Polyangia bacterium]|jgi:4-alpha-glucanotransferase